MVKNTLKEVKHYKSKALPSYPVPDAILYIKADDETEVTTYITDLNGVPYLLKDNGGGSGTGVQTIINNDGTLSVIGSNNIVINLSTSIKNLINSALQPGSNISDLVNDEGYITLADIPSQVVNLQSIASPTNVVVDNTAGADATILAATITNAGVLLPSEKIKLNSLSGLNSGDQNSIVGISGTKSQYNTSLSDGDFLFVGDITNYTNEEAQDAIGTILLDTTTIDLIYDDLTPNISANVKPNSISSSELSNTINITEFVNNAGFEDTTQLNIRDVANRDRANHTGTQAISTINNLQINLDSKISKAGDIMTGSLTSPSFIKTGGTSSQFLKADGTSDSNIYITSAGITGKEDISNKTSTVIGNESSTTLYLNILGAWTYFQQKLTDSILGTFLSTLTSKATPIDADGIVIYDTADSNKAKKTTFTQIKAFLKPYFDTLYTVPQITITTSVSITTATNDSSGFGQKGRNVVISNGANAINITVNGGTGFCASYVKAGTGNITFVQGSGRTLIQVDSLAVLNGIAGSSATITSVGTVDYLRISNA